MLTIQMGKRHIAGEVHIGATKVVGELANLYFLVTFGATLEGKTGLRRKALLLICIHGGYRLLAVFGMLELTDIPRLLSGTSIALGRSLFQTDEGVCLAVNC